MSQKQQLLLIDDVYDLGKSGEIVKVKAGYARNYLVPKQKAVIASKHTLRMQAKLQEERAKKALVEKKGAEEIAKKVEEVTLAIHVKVDPEGRMYGSVSTKDIADLFAKENVTIDKRNIVLKHPIKETGVFEIEIKLQEGVTAKVNLKVIQEKPAQEVIPEKATQEETPLPEANG